LANVVDDYLMGISHVIRGEEWLPSAPLHVMLYRYLGWEEVMPKFAHLPLLLKPEGNGKLSKRDGDRLGFPVFPLQWTDPQSGETSSGYRESGYFPEAVANMLALLGWHPSDNRELFSMAELIEAFSLEKVSKSGAKFDVNKAHWFNQQYLSNTSDEQLMEVVWAQFQELYGSDIDRGYAVKVLALLREKFQFAKDIAPAAHFFYGRPASYDEAAIAKKWKEDTNASLFGLAEAFAAASASDAEGFEACFRAACEALGKKTGELMQPMRIALSGEAMGPPIFELLALLGTAEVVDRLKLATEKITA
jgi:glutamyl-tRNA synthetase